MYIHVNKQQKTSRQHSSFLSACRSSAPPNSTSVYWRQDTTPSSEPWLAPARGASRTLPERLPRSVSTCAAAPALPGQDPAPLPPVIADGIDRKTTLSNQC